MHLYACIFARNTGTYLQIPTVGMCRYLTELFRIFCAGFCAVSSPSARLHGRRMAVAWPSHCRCIAVASPSHRRNASPPHYHRIAIASPQRIGDVSRRCTKCRRLVEFIRITLASGAAADSLHAEEVEPQQIQQRALALWAERR